MAEAKGSKDFIRDGILNRGVHVGRFEFETTGKTVYALSDLSYISSSEAMMFYQISKLNYERLLAMSLPDRMPDPPVPAGVTSVCRKRFLCGGSDDCERPAFTIFDAEREFLEESRREKTEERTEETPAIPISGFGRMTCYYRGETERNFRLAFVKAVGIEHVTYPVEGRENLPPQTVFGRILVPKEHEKAWITGHRFYMDWEVVALPVPARRLKGYEDPHWRVVLDHTSGDDVSTKYVIFQSPEGCIVGETPCSELKIADSMEEYGKLSEEAVNAMCYSSEMDRAR